MPDDMDSALPEDEHMIKEFFATRGTTGLAVNYNKTTMYRIGSLSRSKAEIYTKCPCKVTDIGINVLGVEVRSDDTESIQENYTPILRKIDSIFEAWFRRNLLLEGKINIVNTLVASLFVYKMMVLPNLPNAIHQQIEEKISKFLWNGKRPKIPLKDLQLPQHHGGLKLVDLRKKEISLKVSWIKEVIKDPHLANLMYAAIENPIGDVIWSSNLKESDVEKVFVKCNNQFWIDVMKAWCKFNF